MEIPCVVLCLFICARQINLKQQQRERERHRQLPECLTAATPLPLPSVSTERIPLPNVKSKNFWATSESAIVAAICSLSLNLSWTLQLLRPKVSILKVTFCPKLLRHSTEHRSVTTFSLLLRATCEWGTAVMHWQGIEHVPPRWGPGDWLTAWAIGNVPDCNAVWFCTSQRTRS